MKFSRQWLNDYVDLSDLSDDQLGVRLTEIGHAVEATEQHGDDTFFDLEITTNRVDAMSHIGMERELAAALGRATKQSAAPQAGARTRPVNKTARRAADWPSVECAADDPHRSAGDVRALHGARHPQRRGQ